MNVEQSFFDDMKTKRKRTETISETATLLIVKNTTAADRAGWCGECQADVMWISVAALDLFGITTLPENGAIHMSGSDVCSRSLIKEIKNGENI